MKKSKKSTDLKKMFFAGIPPPPENSPPPLPSHTPKTGAKPGLGQPTHSGQPPKMIKPTAMRPDPVVLADKETKAGYNDGARPRQLHKNSKNDKMIKETHRKSRLETPPETQEGSSARNPMQKLPKYKGGSFFM